MGSQQLNLQARPKSAVPAGVVVAGLCAFVITLAVIWSWHPFRYVLGNTVLLLAVVVWAACGLDLLVQRHGLWALSGLVSVRPQREFSELRMTATHIEVGLSGVEFLPPFEFTGSNT